MQSQETTDLQGQLQNLQQQNIRINDLLNQIQITSDSIDLKSGFFAAIADVKLRTQGLTD